jgi:hypothetical protein
MGTYIVSVYHTDRYELGADTSAQALSIAKDCVADNYGGLYFENAAFDVMRVDIPQAGDLTDAGLAGE